MKNLPMDLLRTYVTVVELGSFTAAAELLGRTQPAISLQLKRLEELVGQNLLIRQGLQVEQSHAGRIIFRYAKQILALNDEVLSQFITTAVSGKIHIGIPSEFATTLLPKILGRFSQAYPSVSLEVTSSLSQQLLAEQKQKQYDLILALHHEPTMPNAQYVKAECVKEDELVWLSSGNHDVHLQDPLPLIIAPDGCRYRERAIEKLEQAGRRWRIVYTNPDLAGIQAAVNEGLGVTVLAKSTVPEAMHLLKASDKLPKLGSIGISVVYQNPRINKATEYLVDYIKASLS